MRRAGHPLASAGLVVALLGAAAGAAPAQDRCESIDGSSSEGRLVGVSVDGVVTLATRGVERRLPLDELRRIDLGRAPAAVADAPPATLWLRSGLALPASLASADATAGRFRLAFADDDVEIPWRYVRAVRFGAEPGLDDGFADKLRDPSERLDVLYAHREGGGLQRLSVEFEGFEADSMSVRFGGKQRSVPLQRLYGVVFAEQRGAPPDAQPMPLVDVQLRSGTALGGKLLELDAERARLRLAEGVELSLPRTELSSLTVRTDKLLFLTDVEPQLQQTPAFDTVWPCLRNRGPDGDVIRLGGKTYRSGYVLTPRTRLSYALGGRYDQLETTIGMEERAGRMADAVFRVLGDGRLLFDSGDVTPATEPRALRVPISGVQTLTLEADFGKDFDFGDLCVFAVPRVLKN